MSRMDLLTDRDRLPEQTRTFLSERSVGEAVIVGGTAVVAESVADELRQLDASMEVQRLAGATRYGTARRVNEWAEGAVPDHNAAGLLVANGTNFPDALAGGPLGAKRGNLLMIVPPTDALADAEARAYLEARGDGPLERITLLGGRAVLSLYQQWQLDQIVVR
jgi:putative cell wall-binding protein